jgi:hypothetical protein
LGWQILQWYRDSTWTKPPGGEIGSKFHVLNHHSYCCQLNSKICAKNGDPKPDPLGINMKHCRNWHEGGFNKKQEAADYLGVPMFMSEFGACSNSDTCADEINQIIDVTEQRLIGWTYWQYKSFHDFTSQV